MKCETQSPQDDAEKKMIELLRAKRDDAMFAHDDVVAGASTLSKLFEDEDYIGIMDFLRNGESKHHAGQALVVAGDPANSIFYFQITSGIMSGRFLQAEIEVVENWINSLN